jgi:hypothetical protein
VPVVAIAGQVFDTASTRVDAVDLVATFGEDAAFHDTLTCIERSVTALLDAPTS